MKYTPRSDILTGQRKTIIQGTGNTKSKTLSGFCYQGRGWEEKEAVVPLPHFPWCCFLKIPTWNTFFLPPMLLEHWQWKSHSCRPSWGNRRRLPKAGILDCALSTAWPWHSSRYKEVTTDLWLGTGRSTLIGFKGCKESESMGIYLTSSMEYCWLLN